MTYFVYVIENQTGKHYIGMSADVAKRILTHNSGKVRSTRPYRPWVVIYTESFPDRAAAHKREVVLKTNYTERAKILGK